MLSWAHVACNWPGIKLHIPRKQEQVAHGILWDSILCTVSTLPCYVFLFINGTMLFTLRSKSVFRETSRYVLLYNLLVAETILLVQGQLMYIMAACRITLTYPVCGVFTMLANLTSVISPLTLVLMCLERYVAVCYSLRHATIITIRNTEVAIVVIWTVSSLRSAEPADEKILLFGKYMLLGPMSKDYDKVYTYCLFVSAGVSVICSYIGVMAAARSASTDKASARKACNTLLLHLVQLCLSLSSTTYNPMLIAIYKVLDRIILVRIQTVLYVCIIIFPRCLSSLIYGLRDQTIRPILIYHLRCQLKLSIIPAKAEVTV
ncbi:odorant receptor 131-2-like [Chaetodon auriga]|uniref:odorant receptor 131-2-like n=1 Tax=Chaetodon auriga TaxID=39042 RepID=UPI0040330852